MISSVVINSYDAAGRLWLL